MKRKEERKIKEYFVRISNVENQNETRRIKGNSWRTRQDVRRNELVGTRISKSPKISRSLRVAAQGRSYVPGSAIILRNRHLAETTTNDERDAFLHPGTTILSPETSLVLIVVSRKDRRNTYSAAIKRKCRRAERAEKLRYAFGTSVGC